jgi:gas vesicle protein GvpL/GvpF
MATELKRERRVIYLYGITESPTHKHPELIGVDRLAEVEAIECEKIFCWISRVSALEFEKNLAHNMENLDWLAETSVAHQRVIAAIARDVEMLPTRLGIIFRSEASLCKHIAKRAGSLKRDFTRIRGADEWGVKVFEIEPPVATPSKVRSGKDYLKAKAALLPARRERSASAGEIARLEKALESVATEIAPPGTVSRGQHGLKFQMSLLVKRTKQKKLESVLEKFARDWASQRRIECTGPWPPYSFVSRPDDGVRPK